MSEPLSTNEIEDVVSSVRRLVSPEARPRTMSRDLGLDRLILTPSLRIVAEQPASGPMIVKLETVAKKSRPGARKPNAGKGQAVADTMTAAPSAAMTDERATEDPGLVFSPAIPSLAEMALRAEDAELIIGDDSEPLVPPRSAGRKAKSATGTAGKASAGAKSAKEAAPGAKIKAANRTTAKPVASAAEPVTGQPKAERPVERKPAVERAVSAGATGVRQGDARRGEARRDRGRPSATKPATSVPGAGKAAEEKPARKPVAAKRVTDPALAEPEVIPALAAPEAVQSAVLEAGPEAALTLVAVEASLIVPAEAVITEGAAQSPDPHPMAGNAGPFLTDGEGNPISILDEEELMLILRRVIREELQGVLGERITRNVRKLVRAEIARALTAQTLD